MVLIIEDRVYRNFFTVSNLHSILVSVVGACILIWLLGLIKRK
ncbi:GlsB/YeaQ/YmgE family stress response membrane protein [Fusobacterium canifelinum]|uniref:GlsB/YeaQ/YmgE family stress response membrane protein n=1 Tax=Fusobacterium canifelinum TaxID=285729 RepID=A0ABX7CHY9_9FUSO|nr:GlsB/YeaQ/YmgE family stress response membrane protein [Fusobacterium canifelinum]